MAVTKEVKIVGVILGGIVGVLLLSSAVQMLVSVLTWAVPLGILGLAIWAFLARRGDGDGASADSSV